MFSLSYRGNSLGIVQAEEVYQMMLHKKNLFFVMLVVFLSAYVTVAAEENKKLPPAASRPVDFQKDIKPILAERCTSCHGEHKQKHKLRVDSRAALLEGGENGPAIVVGNSEKSLLVQVVAGIHPEIDQMPPKGDPLTDDQIGLLRAWIDQGATWPESEKTIPSPPPTP